MKRVILLIVIVVLLLTLSCEKNSSNSFIEINITGIDYSMRPCSGGYVGEIGEEKYRCLDIVPNNILSIYTVFPKTFLIKYERPNGACYEEKNLEIKIKIIAIKNL